MIEEERAVQQVVDGHRALATAGHGDMIWGHLAIRDPKGRGVWSKAAGWGMEEVTAERVVLVSFDGDVLFGDGSRHLEAFIHTELMRARPDVNATVHTHALAATSFASLDIPLRPLTHAATPFLATGDVPRFTETGDLIRSAALGASLARAVGDDNGCLIPGHGLVTVGADVSAAVLHAVLLDNACNAALLAAAAGGPRRWSSDAEVEAKRTGLWPPTAARSAFDYLVRRADRRADRITEGTS